MSEELELLQELTGRVEKLEAQVKKWKEFEKELETVLDEYNLNKKGPRPPLS